MFHQNHKHYPKRPLLPHTIKIIHGSIKNTLFAAVKLISTPASSILLLYFKQKQQILIKTCFFRILHLTIVNPSTTIPLPEYPRPLWATTEDRGRLRPPEHASPSSRVGVVSPVVCVRWTLSRSAFVPRDSCFIPARFPFQTDFENAGCAIPIVLHCPLYIGYVYYLCGSTSK